MKHGWIKIHRQMQEHWIFQDAEYLKAWITILLEVNHAPKKVLYGKKLLECDRGESLHSLDEWGSLFGSWGKKKVHRFFELLKKDGMIDTQSVTITTRLKVLNYSNYQDIGHAQEPPSDTHRNHQVTRVGDTNKNDKNIKNEKKEKKRAQYSDDFQEFWKAYPFRNGKKPNKQEASKEFEAAIKRTDKDTIMKAIAIQSKTEEWEKDNGSFVPDACRWLKKSRWDDEVQEQQQSSSMPPAWREME